MFVRLFKDYIMNIENLFYYTSENLIRNAPFAVSSGGGWYGYIRKHVKQEEDKSLGLSEMLLKNPDKKITKNDILLYINKHRLIIEETILEGNDINYLRKKYSTSGLENYREIVISTPKIESYYVDDVHFSDVAGGKEICWCRCADFINAGEKILVIDEMQSARHQAARTFGYKSDFIFKSYKNEDIKEILLDKQLSVDEKADKINYYCEAIAQAASAFENAIEDAPFRKWYEFLTKRILQYAISHDYSELRIAGGDLQAERYSVDSIAVRKLYDEVIIGYIKKYLKHWNIKPILHGHWWIVEFNEAIKKDLLHNLQPLFRQDDTIINESVSNTTIRQRAEALAKKYSLNLLPSEKVLSCSPNLKGYYDQLYDKIYIVYNNHHSFADLDTTVVHEMLAHRGLRKMLGSRYCVFIKNVFDNIMSAEQRQAYMKKYHNFITAGEEFCADAFKFLPVTNTIIQQICSKVRIYLFQIGFNVKLSDSDLCVLISLSLEKNKKLQIDKKHGIRLL